MDRIDQTLRERISEAAAEFDKAFVAANARPSTCALDQLRDATDRLMRAASRVMIEIEQSDKD